MKTFSATWRQETESFAKAGPKGVQHTLGTLWQSLKFVGDPLLIAVQPLFQNFLEMVRS